MENIPQRIYKRFDDNFLRNKKYSGILKDAYLIVGMHADSAMEYMAKCMKKRVAIIPCCVFAYDFPKRKLKRNGGKVKEYHEFIEYLREINEDLEMTRLQFKGRNIVLYTT